MTEQPSLHKRFVDFSQPMRPEETGATPVLKELQNVKAIVYDFYGTLFISGVGDIGIDDGSSDANLLIDALKSAGVQITAKQAGAAGFKIYNEIVEQEINDAQTPYPEPDIRTVWEGVLDRMVTENLISIPSKEYPSEQVAAEFEMRMNPVWPMPGAVDMLSYFKTGGILQGIISNSQFYTLIALEALTGKSIDELGLHPDLLHWSYEEKMKKPGLPFYKSFIKKLNQTDSKVTPAEVLYVGNDMLKDVYPADAIGFKTALFAGDKRSLKWRQNDDRCKNLQPDLVLTSFSQLKKCVEI